ncbi:sigma-70 family RNA polymerase sigma factor [Saccharopolyspora rhizosphaerae]
MRVLHDQHAPALRSYALELTGGDRARAEDVVQETMLRAWRHPKVLDQSARSARSWLLTVARRIAIDEWRSGTSRAEVMTDAPPERVDEDGTDRAVQSWLVADALAELSARHREVLALCYYQGLSVADAAARLGVPEGTVKSRTHYALRALRLALEERGVTR